MSTEFSSLEGHQYVPGEEPTLAERLTEILAGYAPYAGTLAAISMLLLVWVVYRGAMRKRQKRKDKAKKDAPKELTPVQRARIAQRKRLKAAFDERQEAAAKARADLRAQHFGDAHP